MTGDAELLYQRNAAVPPGVGAVVLSCGVHANALLAEGFGRLEAAPVRVRT